MVTRERTMRSYIVMLVLACLAGFSIYHYVVKPIIYTIEERTARMEQILNATKQP